MKNVYCLLNVRNNYFNNYYCLQFVFCLTYFGSFQVSILLNKFQAFSVLRIYQLLICMFQKSCSDFTREIIQGKEEMKYK